MDKESLSGKMEGSIKDNIIMIKKKAMENLDGQMAAGLKVSGSMENKKGMEFIIIQKVK
jgi:hypothetical protein